MKCVERRLVGYRKREAACGNRKIPDRGEGQFRSDGDTIVYSIIISKFTDVLLKPIQLWLYFHYNWPRLCIVCVVLLWLLVQFYFIYIGFGLVFFVSSLFACIFINLGRRKSGELSAYSVFNPQCEQLPGTLTAAHFERDLLKRGVLRK